MSKTKAELIARAKEILTENRRKGYTIPSAGIYPFQWNWDSAFIAIGLSLYNLDDAIEELDTLFSAQWENGFLPHIIFWDKNKEHLYFPNSKYYKSGLSAHARDVIGTSGFTQPPIHGMALEYMLENCPKAERFKMTTFIERIFPYVLHYHEYLYAHRNVDGDGLIHIIHNWESGTDNLPVWDSVFEHISNLELPEYDLENMRKDIIHIDRKERPTHEEYTCYLHILDICRDSNYNDDLITERTPFMVQDPLFNALLIRSNESLIKLADIAGYHSEIEMLQRMKAKTTKALNEKLWDEELGCYVYYDCKAEEYIRERTAPGMVPVITDAVDEHKLEKIINLLNSEHFGGASDDTFCCPSFDMKSPKFESQRYWRGPVWINMNWLLMQGFARHGKNDVYDVLESNLLDLITRFGFSEYYEPQKALEGKHKMSYGGNQFSWSAALYLDVVKSRSAELIQDTAL